jgi:hypothetical protein
MDGRFKIKSKLYNYKGQYVGKPLIFFSEIIITVTMKFMYYHGHILYETLIIFPQSLLHFQHTSSTFA